MKAAITSHRNTNSQRRWRRMKPKAMGGLSPTGREMPGKRSFYLPPRPRRKPGAGRFVAREGRFEYNPAVL